MTSNKRDLSKKIAGSILRTGFSAFSYLLNASEPYVLMYHSIDSSGSSISVSKEQFREQMSYLKEEEFRCLSVSELIRNLESGKKPPSQKAVCITFDDGFKNNYIDALPILRDFGFKATIFLTTGYIGKKAAWVGEALNRISPDYLESLSKNKENIVQTEIDFNFLKQKMPQLVHLSDNEIRNELASLYEVSDLPMLSWTDIKEMDNRGIDFAAHSVNHPFLSDLDANGVREEIGRSKTQIEEKLNKLIEYFSYPYGNSNPKVKNCVKELGFAAAFSDYAVGNKNGLDLYSLDRIPIGCRVSLREFRFCLSPGSKPYFRLRRFFQKGD